MGVSDTVARPRVGARVRICSIRCSGIPIAWAADRYNRRNIIAAGLAFWSLMTSLTGWVASIWQLAVVRFLMGAGEACGLAPSNSMIADMFRKERRALALSIFGTGSSLAYIVFFPILGAIGELYGWRQMFVFAGVPGILLSLVFYLTVREPERTGGPAQAQRLLSNDPRGIFADLGFLFRTPAYLYLLAASTFMGLNVFAASIWTPTFLERVHGLSIGTIASIIGPIRGIFGFAGLLLGGFLIDRLIRRSPHWRVTVPGLACLILAPVEVAFLLSEPKWIWLTAFAASAALTLVHQGPLFALVMEVVPSRMRAIAIATLVLSSGLLGQAGGPLIVGALNDWLGPTMGQGAIRYSMLIIAVTAALSGLLILMAGRHLEDGRAKAAEV